MPSSSSPSSASAFSGRLSSRPGSLSLRALASGCCLLLSCLLLLPTGVRCYPALYFNTPYPLVEAVGNGGEVLAVTAALFGQANYENTFGGTLVYAGNGNFTNNGGSARYGCGTFDVSSNQYWATMVASQQPVVLWIDRNPLNSGCFFTQKVYNAQVSGGLVTAVIVGDPLPGQLVYMKNDDSGKTVNIPSMFVDSVTWNTVSPYWDSTEVVVEMEFYLPNPDSRVELDVYYDMLDSSIFTWLTTFGSPARVLGPQLFTTPHWKVVNGSVYGCTAAASAYCVANCLPNLDNSSWYCNDPASRSSLLYGVTGAQALQEVVRQSCLFTFISTPLTALYANSSSYWMWTYWEQFYANCAAANSTSRLTDSCSWNAMTVALSNVPGVTLTQVQNCVAIARAGGYAGILPSLAASWSTTGPIITPFVYINLTPYYGTINCPLPITESTCGILSGACYGYSIDNSSYPQACLWPNNCPFGTQSCNGTTPVNPVYNNTVSNGINAGAVVGIVIAFLVVALGVAYYWYRRQLEKQRQEMDALLRQYLPMDPGATHGVAQNNHKTREQQERRLIQDMDLEDQEIEQNDDI